MSRLRCHLPRLRRLIDESAGSRRVSWVWGLQLLVILGLLLAAHHADNLNNRAGLDRTRTDLEQQMTRLRSQLETEVQINIQTVRGLVASIATEPEMEQARFAELARYLLASRSQIRNIAAAPDMVIRMVYPVAGNEVALGLDYRSNAVQWPEVLQAAESGQLVLAGPLELVQGGRAFIGRIPVIIDDGAGEPARLWGMVSTAINEDQLYRLSGLTEIDGLQLALAKLSGGQTEVFFGDPAVLTLSPVIQPVAVPGADWLLMAVPQGGWPLRADNAGLFRMGLLLLGLLLVVPTLMLTWSIQRERSSQLRLQGLFELSPLGIALLDHQSRRFLWVNPALEQMLGYQRGQLAATPWNRILAGREEEMGLSLASLPLKQEGVAISWDARRLPVRMTFSRLMLEEDRRLCWLILEDLSDSKRVERLKSEFVSTVSHELRTPLTSISGSLALVAGGALGPLPDRVQSVLDIARANSERLTRLINDLLDMEKLMSGKMRCELAPHDLTDILQQSLAACEGYAAGFSVHLELDTGEAHPTVLVDADRLQQVLLNLIANAIKFSHPGGIVSVALTQAEGWARVTVTDQGPGVPETFRAQLFEPFAQADASDSRHKAGTGLGLAISRELMDRMGGRIGLAPAADRPGACFYIELPADGLDQGLDRGRRKHVTN